MGAWGAARMDVRMGAWEDEWVVCMCAMMLAVLLFVGCADVCVDGCRSGSCIDVGWVDVCSEVVLNFADFFRRLRREEGWQDGRMDGRAGGLEDGGRLGACASTLV